jgi:hypothetical protein
MDNREKLMINLTEFKRQLYYDKVEESLSALRQALTCYDKPEIYAQLDVELIHFIIHMDDTLNFEKRNKILGKVKEILLDTQTENPHSPIWLIEIIDLKLGSFPTSDDPSDVMSLRTLINKFPASLEIRLALALALIQDSIEKNNELGFKESMNLFSDLAPMFSKKEDRVNRYRVYSPIDPENLFIRLRIWAICQYSVFLQNHERDDEAIQLLTSQASEPWIKLASVNEKSMFLMEIKILQRGQQITENIGIKYEEKLKHWVAVIIGVPFFASLTGGILAGNHLTYPEVAKLIFVIVLSTLLIISVSLLILSSNRKRIFSYLTPVSILFALCVVTQYTEDNISPKLQGIALIPKNHNATTDTYVSIDSEGDKPGAPNNVQHSLIPVDTSTGTGKPQERASADMNTSIENDSLESKDHLMSLPQQISEGVSG